MNLSFSTRGWPDLSWDDMIATALDMGFSGIEVYNLPKFDNLLEKGSPFCCCGGDDPYLQLDP